jgi:hypothetical protein
MIKRTSVEKKKMLRKLIKFCIDNDYMYEEMPIADYDKQSPEINVMIPNWKK